MTTPRLAIFTAVALLCLATDSTAQSSANVAVVINEQSPASIQIGEYYAKMRAVPAENIIRIKSAIEDEIGRTDYARSIEAPIANGLAKHGLQDRILFIVLTKGIPLRISGTAGQNGTAASVDSELTLLYRRMTGRPVPPAGFIDNPYYLGAGEIGAAKRFSHRNHDIFLVTRLDGSTADDVRSLIDRGMTPSTSGAIVLDQRKDASSVIPDRWTGEAARAVLAIAPDRKVVLDETVQPAVTSDDVIGYYSAGATPGTLKERAPGFKFSNGALVASLASSDARSFEAPLTAAGPMLSDLIRAGATGAAGNVAEPYLQSSLRPQILFPAYLSGLNLAEAFYLSLPHLGWQSVVVGDPLSAPFASTRTTDDLDPAIDAETELPAFFSTARLQNARSEMKDLPARAVSLIVRAEARQRRGDNAGAKQALQEATELAPGSAAAQMKLAMMHEEDGESDQATARYRAVVKAEPNNVMALNNLAYSLAERQGSVAEALPLARRAVTLAPSNPTIVDTLAWIEHLLGNDREAARLLEPIVKQSTGAAEVHLHAAIVFAALGRHVAADAQLKETLRLNPELTDREDVKVLRARLAAVKK